VPATGDTPTASFIVVPGGEETTIDGDTGALLREVNEFVDATLSTFRAKRLGEDELDLDRVLATLLFTDIVGSTRRAAELGDRRWTELLEAHNARIRALLARYQGREVDTAGDGVLAAFDAPARAISVRAGNRRCRPRAWARGPRRRPYRGVLAVRGASPRPGGPHRRPRRGARRPFGGARLRDRQGPRRGVGGHVRRAQQPGARRRPRGVATLRSGAATRRPRGSLRRWAAGGHVTHHGRAPWPT
jgi:hypothetical protein